MTHESQTTTDPEIIRKWMEDRGGKPAKVKGTEAGGTALLRIQFDEKQDKLEPMTWEEFFDQFEKNDLAFLYQEETKEGEQSRFFKFISRK